MYFTHIHRCNHVYGTLLGRCINVDFCHYRRVAALQRGNSARIAKDPLHHPRENGIQIAGRMCEVGPPASGQPSSLALIRTGGAQQASCSARQPTAAGMDGRQ